MKFAHWLSIILAYLLMGLSASAKPPTMPVAPTDSVYNLDLRLVDQDGKAFELRSLRGQPILVSMFYTSCKYTCPLTIEQIRRTVSALSEADRKNIRVLMVSFDPVRDTPAVLRATGAEHHVDFSHWTLARTNAEDVRKFAAIMGIQYRAMTNGDFNHSTVVTLLDRDGRIVTKSEQTGRLDPLLVEASSRVLHESQ